MKLKLWFRHCDPLVVLFCALGLEPIRASAGLIVGIDTGDFPEHILAVDPLTGNITSLPTVFGGLSFATSSGPVSNSILVLGVNLYQLDVVTGQTSLYACVQALCPWVRDLAYDSSNGVIYGLATPPGGGPESLVQLNDSGMPYPGIPGSHWISYSSIGELGVAGIWAMEFVPGLGLYGVANGSTPAGFTIDVTTGQASFLAPLSEPVFPYGVTGLAYDPDTGGLLASSGVLGDIGSEPPGAIFLLDPGNGLVTPLNVDAPNLYGIAYVGTPEAAPAWMLLVGLTACFAIRRFRRLCR